MDGQSLFQKLSKIIRDVLLAYRARSRIYIETSTHQKHICRIFPSMPLSLNKGCVERRRVIKEKHCDCNELQDLIGDIVRGNFEDLKKIQL